MFNYYMIRYPSPKSHKLDLQSLQHPSKDSYNAFAAYGASKLCCMLLSQELHRRYSSDLISCNAVHPGNLLPTQLLRKTNCMYKALRLMAHPFTSSTVSSTNDCNEFNCVSIGSRCR